MSNKKRKFKPHFKMVDGVWRLYRDREELRKFGPIIWYALESTNPRDMWNEREQRSKEANNDFSST